MQNNPANQIEGMLIELLGQRQAEVLIRRAGQVLDYEEQDFVDCLQVSAALMAAEGQPSSPTALTVARNLKDSPAWDLLLNVFKTFTALRESAAFPDSDCKDYWMDAAKTLLKRMLEEFALKEGNDV